MFYMDTFREKTNNNTRHFKNVVTTFDLLPCVHNIFVNFNRNLNFLDITTILRIVPYQDIYKYNNNHFFLANNIQFYFYNY